MEEALRPKCGKIPLEIADILVEKIVIESPERIDIKCTYADLLEKWCGEMQIADLEEGGMNG